MYTNISYLYDVDWMCGYTINVMCLCVGYSLDFDTVRDAVVKYGCNDWYEIGLKLGLNGNEIIDKTHVIPPSTGKLLAVIEAKRVKDGKEKTAEDLLRACYCMSTPIGKQVEDELKKGEILRERERVA